MHTLLIVVAVLITIVLMALVVPFNGVRGVQGLRQRFRENLTTIRARRASTAPTSE